MNIVNKISDLRKEKGLSRDTLGKLVGTSDAIIGRYEREEIIPSINVAKKMLYRLELCKRSVKRNVMLFCTCWIPFCRQHSFLQLNKN
ncbi:helix-turn-helix transcriptional regulator [Flavobacterium sp. CS20]|uniref:helix-turn-helix domain-containing protein n=1 Tax=Flavobacterium sp. CS20 TaxID=2775246 RepID=UPI001B39E945|nr:helix-turn-helix transcriptional regulator [Flavobacterium sp. CS20]